MLNKVIKVCIVALLAVLAVINFVFAGNWVKVDDNWRYEKHRGDKDYLQEKWREIDGKVYYFDYDGNMVKGPVVIDGRLYIYDDNDGFAITTGFDIDGIHYETSGKGLVMGLPKFTDLSNFPKAKTFASGIQVSNNNTIYDDNNNVTPTAPSKAIQE